MYIIQILCGKLVPYRLHRDAVRVHKTVAEVRSALPEANQSAGIWTHVLEHVNPSVRSVQGRNSSDLLVFAESDSRGGAQLLEIGAFPRSRIAIGFQKLFFRGTLFHGKLSVVILALVRADSTSPGTKGRYLFWN